MANPFGRQRRNQQRRDDRASRDALEAKNIWHADPFEASEEWSETDYPSATMKISQRTVTLIRNSHVIEFAVVLWVLESGEWSEKLCVDSCNHGSVHRHRDGDHSRLEVIEVITSQEVLQNHYWEAVGEAYDEIRKLEAGNV